MSAPMDSETGQERQMGNRPSRDWEISEFLLRLCHDMRTPARAIRGHAELLAKDFAAVGDPGVPERLGFITTGIQSVEALAEGLASYSLALRIEAGSFQPTQMEVLLRLVLAKLRKEVQAVGAEVSHGALPQIHGNPDRLSQLWENLILNAIRHRGPEAPRIQVSADVAEQSWRFAVRDNGPGIESAYLEKIFKPFERLRGKQTPGCGLGLAIAREIVERHGGRIWAESAPGAGSTFFFTLPAG